MSLTTVAQVLRELEAVGDNATRAILLKHGAKDPCFGVKIEALKAVLKKTNAHHDLAMDLFNSKVFDAMYLAGLMMNGSTMSRKERR